MNRFEGWVHGAINALEDEFTGRDGRDESRREYVDRLTNDLQHVGFPGIISILAARDESVASEKIGDELIGKIADELVAGPFDGVTRDDVGAYVRDVLIKRKPMDEAFFAHDELKDELMRAAIEEIAEKAGVATDDAMVDEAVRLLETGEFFGDIASTTAAVAFVVRRLPIDLVHDAIRVPFHTVKLGVAAGIDLFETPIDAFHVVRDILEDHRLDNPPGVLDHTFRALYGMSTAQTIAQTIHRLIGPDNGSVRLLLLVYARANGLPATPEHLDAVDALFRDTRRPDLGPALTFAVNHLLERYGADELSSRITRLAE